MSVFTVETTAERAASLVAVALLLSLALASLSVMMRYAYLSTAGGSAATPPSGSQPQASGEVPWVEVNYSTWLVLVDNEWRPARVESTGNGWYRLYLEGPVKPDVGWCCRFFNTYGYEFTVNYWYRRVPIVRSPTGCAGVAG